MTNKSDPPNGGGMFSYISNKFSKKNAHQYSKDKIVSVKLQFVKTNISGHNKKRLYLVITYVKGFQVFDMNNPDNPKEMVNKKTTQPVEFAKIMDYPSKKFVNSSNHRKLLKKLPLLCYVTCDHRKDPLINFYSLRFHKNTDQISGFREPINQVLTSCELFMVVMKKRGYWYNPLTFEKIIHFHIFPNGGCALAERWVAYPSISIVRKREHILTSSTDGAISDVAKKAARGIRIIKNFSSKTMTNMLGGESEAAPSQADQINYSAFPNVGTVEVRDIYSKSVLCHFQAHTKTISMLEFDHSGTILVTTSVSGNHLNVYKIYPTHNEEEANVRLLHKLHRGITEARIRSIVFSINNRFLAVTSDHGTTHLFIIHPEGGRIPQDHHIQMTLPPTVADSPEKCVKNAPVARIHHPGWLESENRYSVSAAFFTTRKNMEQLLVMTPSGNISKFNVRPTRVTFQTETLSVQVEEDAPLKNLCRELDFRERKPVPIIWEDKREIEKQKKLKKGKEEASAKRRRNNPYSFGGGGGGGFGYEEEEDDDVGKEGKVRERKKSVDTLLIGNVEIESYRHLKKPIWDSGKFKFKTFTTYEKKDEDYLSGSMDLTQTVLVSTGPPRPLGIKDDMKHPMDGISPSGDLGGMGGGGQGGEGKDGMVDDQWEIIENDEFIPEVKAVGEMDEWSGNPKNKTSKSKRELEYERFLKQHKMNDGDEEVPEYDRFTRRNMRQAPGQRGPDKDKYVYGTFKKAEDEKKRKKAAEEERIQEIRRNQARMEFLKRQEQEKKRREMMMMDKKNPSSGGGGGFGYPSSSVDNNKNNRNDPRIQQQQQQHRKIDPYSSNDPYHREKKSSYDQDPRMRRIGDIDEENNDHRYERSTKKKDNNNPYGVGGPKYPQKSSSTTTTTKNPYAYPSTTSSQNPKRKDVGGRGYDFPSREPLKKTEGEPRLNSNPIFDDDDDDDELDELDDVPEPVLGSAASALKRSEKKKVMKKNGRDPGQQKSNDYVFSYPKIGGGGGGVKDNNNNNNDEYDIIDTNIVGNTRPKPNSKKDDRQQQQPNTTNPTTFPGSGFRLGDNNNDNFNPNNNNKNNNQQQKKVSGGGGGRGGGEDDEELNRLSDPSIQDYFAKQLAKSEIMKKEEKKKIDELFNSKEKIRDLQGGGGNSNNQSSNIKDDDDDDDDDGFGNLPSIPEIPSVLPQSPPSATTTKNKNPVDDIMNLYSDKNKKKTGGGDDDDDGKRIQGSGGLMYPGMNYGGNDDKKKGFGDNKKDGEDDNDNYGIIGMDSDDDDDDDDGDGDSYFNDIMKQIQQQSDEKDNKKKDDEDEDEDEENLWSV